MFLAVNAVVRRQDVDDVNYCLCLRLTGLFGELVYAEAMAILCGQTCAVLAVNHMFEVSHGCSTSCITRCLAQGCFLVHAAPLKTPMLSCFLRWAELFPH